MLRTKKADRIVCVCTVLMLLVSVLLWGVVEPVRGDGSHTVGYESLLFDQSRVHTIDITMADWDSFITNATAEEYTDCNIAVDGEKFSHVAIRAKGNTSLSSVASLGSTRYSFKVEFDHYVEGMTYHGLDKLSLNNLIQDATMMKDYLAYTLMSRMNVPAPLCSYVQINVNGEAWGLYLAVEGVEDAFMDRNGMTKGELYKPDSMSFGGGRGNGRDFDIEKFREENKDAENAETSASETPFGNGFPGSPPDGFSGAFPEGMGNMPQMSQKEFNPFTGGTASDGAEPSERPDFGNMPNGGGFNFGMGSDDVKLIYSDDDPDSYSNIFNNAKTQIKAKDKARLIASLKKLNAQEDLDSVVNKDEVIRYLAVHDFLCNGDSYTGMMVHNYYLYEEKGQLSIIPWDYNLGFGGFTASTDATSTVNSPIDSPVSGGTVDSRPLISWIFSDGEALTAYHEAYDRFIAENIESGWLENEIARVQEMITPYLEKDASAFYDMEAFEKAVSTLQIFCAKRGESVRGQLNGIVPSTSAQQQNSSALIDASDISTADMGSMNNGQGGPGNGGPGGGMPAGIPDFNSGANSFTPPQALNQGDKKFFGGSANSSAENAQATDAPSQPPAAEETTAPAAANMPLKRPAGFRDGDFPGAQQSGNPSQWIHLAICAFILLAALLIVRRASSHNS